MIEFDFYKPNQTPIVLALGFFDSVHIGHQQLIDKAKTMCSNEEKIAVFTFSNNPFSALKKETKLIYTYEERLIKLAKLNVDCIMSAKFDNEFKEMTGGNFLKQLAKFNIKGIVSGSDYTYGNDLLGVEQLADFCRTNSINYNCVEQVQYNGFKASSTYIRHLLEDGDIVCSNECLGGNYFIKGLVVDGFKEGRKIGFPTANIKLSADKLLPKLGVYLGETVISFVTYKCIVNIGSRPTFNEDIVKVEAHIIGFDSDLYGNEIVIEILKYLRPIIKFDNAELLRTQLLADVSEAIDD